MFSNSVREEGRMFTCCVFLEDSRALIKIPVDTRAPNEPGRDSHLILFALGHQANAVLKPAVSVSARIRDTFIMPAGANGKEDEWKNRHLILRIHCANL